MKNASIKRKGNKKQNNFKLIYVMLTLQDILQVTPVSVTATDTIHLFSH